MTLPAVLGTTSALNSMVMRPRAAPSAVISKKHFGLQTRISKVSVVHHETNFATECMKANTFSMTYDILLKLTVLRVYCVGLCD